MPDLAAWCATIKGPVAPLLRELLLRLGHFVSTSDLVVLPKMVIAEAGNFPDLARIYREEVVERGLALFGGLLQTGMDRGEFRKVPVQSRRPAVHRAAAAGGDLAHDLRAARPRSHTTMRG